MFSRVWGDKGIGNIVKNYVLERFYGDKCVNYRVLKETLQKHANTLQKTRDLEDFVEKNADNGAQCRLDSFSGRRRRGYLKFPSLGGPHAEEKIEKHPLGGSQGRGPGRPGLRMAAKLFEIEMQITCTNVKKTTVIYVNYLATVTDLRKTCGVGATPRKAG